MEKKKEKKKETRNDTDPILSLIQPTNQPRIPV